jgi:DpnII restriction endonuclease
MARAKSDRVRSKTLAIDDLTQSIEQLQSFVPKLEDLGREGFPYLEGALTRTELQLRECIKRAFGDKSTEFQTHRHLKLALSSSSEKKQTLALIRGLIASLEEKKSELQGVKPAGVQDPSSQIVPPQLTLVPPTVSSGHMSVTSVSTSPPTATVQLVPSVDQTPMLPELSTSTTSIPPTPIPPATESAPATVQLMPPRTPIEPISSLFRTQETKPFPTAQEQAPPSSTKTTQAQSDSPSTAPASTSMEVASHAEPTPIDTATHMQPTSPNVQLFPSTSPSSDSAGGKPQADDLASMTCQEIPAAASSPVLQTSTPASKPAESLSPVADADPLTVTKKTCERFHAVARQLRLRGEYRSTLTVDDEFDVQDLMHALLRQHFDDIGTDEWTPAYSNGAPHTTFLLDHDRLAIVVKKTRTGISRKIFADQVRADTERYRARGRCTQLLCFIYDPEGRIGNPRGLENELTSTSEHFTVDVVVAPK